MPGRILVVDDIPTNRMVLRAKLAANYYDVLEAESGEEALAIAGHEEPDLVLLDVLMPGIDGFETCRRLKAAPETVHIPVVMLTALEGQEDRLRGLQAGADDFLTKPCADMALLTRVSSLVRMKTMLDELRLRHQTSHELGLEMLSAADLEPRFAEFSVLLVCGHDDNVAAAAHAIRRHIGCATSVARGEAEARVLVAANTYDACIIGRDLADGVPMRLASHLRSRPATRHLAVMMVFAPDDMAHAHMAMEMGIADHLTDPPDLAELCARLRVQLRRKHYSDRLRSRVADSFVMALTDPLTGLYNRRYAQSHLAALIARRSGEGKDLAAMVLDLDRFKAVNDRWGHAAGDTVLKDFAHRLRENVRGVDLVSRIGGEEFLVVMPDVTPENAVKVAERVRGAVEESGFEVPGIGVPLPVTTSIGLAFHRPGEDGAALIARADRALYDSKRAGRNMVTLAQAA